MGRIVIVKDFARAVRENGANVSDVKFDPGGGNNITGEHFSSLGDDSYPMLGIDYGVAVDVPRKGGAVIVGYVDPINTPKATKGEKRIYARDANGDSIAEAWLKSDGSIHVISSDGSFILDGAGSIKGSNSSGDFELKADGSFNMNGVIIDASGNVTMPGTLSVAGKDFATHAHIGSPTAPVGSISPTGIVI